ncbi:DNA repair protein RAD5A [Fusarium oxysporum f. sp. raphani]|uniref:DNA repair protein RAD5A n=1 Tax=Fusarium oxysporum f. sp. raphani TaxID=96318 RepID=A0A8J5TVU7_FUSOX|nr:DNA repair protein RAD5A [Fusarium oxysporum f. sp. raphani]
MAAKLYDFLGSTNVPAQFRRVDVSNKLITPLKRHQEIAVAMMVEKESGNLQQQKFPSLWTEEFYDLEHKIFKNNITGATQLHPPPLCLGGILADEMGLGKTLSTLALVVGTAADPQASISSNPEDQRTLIVAPLSTLGSWEEEIKRRIKPGLISYTIYHGNKRHLVPFNQSSIVLATYETLKADQQREAETSDAMFNGLHHQIWHRVILDEAHIIRNRRSKVFRVVCDLKARHRWCLTGTPVQNHLDDFGALLEFLNVYPFNTPRGFSKILPDGRTGGSASDWKRLTSLFRAVALRRTKQSISSELDLPGREILYHPIKLNESESKFYDKLKQAYIFGSGAGGTPITCFQIILRLRQGVWMSTLLWKNYREKQDDSWSTGRHPA